MKNLYQQEVAKSRTPGQHLVETREDTISKHCCPPYRWDVLYVEDAGAIPERLSPGDEVNHRIRYAFCPRERTRVLRGQLVRTVFHRGKVLFRDVSDQTFCAGTWNIDAFIRVPRKAATGWYVIKLEIRTPGKTIKKITPFFVKGDAGRTALSSRASRPSSRN